MANLSNAIRHKRFKIKNSEDVNVFIDVGEAEPISLCLQNCSISGFLAHSENDFFSKAEIGKIYPNAKLIFQDNVVTMGRVVYRNSTSQDDKFAYGFSLVDAKLPIEGKLSKYIVTDLSVDSSSYDYELSSEKFNLSHFQEEDIYNIDLFDKCQKYKIFYKNWSNTNNFLYREVRKPSKGKRIILNRKRKAGRSDFLSMGSNDYFGLASHPKVCEAASNALKEYGFGSTGSPITTGLSDLHLELSSYISHLFKKEKTILFNSGYAANVGTIQALCKATDITYFDMLSHASIQDGVKLSGTNARLFIHNNMSHLEKVLNKDRAKHSGSLVIAEGVFSMDGDTCRLDEISVLSKKHNSRLMVDEAHSFGVLGNTGLGTCEKFNLVDEVDLIMGTFSKVCGGIGGFVTCSEDVYNWLCTFSRANIFSVSLPPCNVAAALQALKLFNDDKSYLKDLRENIKNFKEGLSGLGYHIPTSHESAVIPFIVGNEAKMSIVLEHLINNGIFPTPVIYPATSRSSCRLRFTIQSSHNESDIDYVISVLEQAVSKADLDLNTINEQVKKIYS